MKKYYFVLVLLSFGYLTAFSQAVQGRKYATQTYMNQIRISDTLFQKNAAALERYTLNFKQYGSMDTVEIPVVFHIVYTGQTPPVTAADIQAQIAQLNIDFFTPAHPYKSDEAYTFGSNVEGLAYLQPADKYEDYAAKTALPMIRFCFPQFDPQGDSTTGILFVASSVQNWGLDKSLKSSNLGVANPGIRKNTAIYGSLR